jgi:hypothetical protein
VGVVVCLLGCSADLGGEPTVTSTWSLEVEANGGLVDPRFPEYGIYPNPLQVESIEVRLDVAGQVCARSVDRDWCGGPIAGIPYQVHERVRPGGSVCHRVVDLFGHDVIERCSAADEVQSARALVTAGAPEGEERCQEARDATGAPCLVCMDAAGIVTKNTCLAAGGPAGDIPTTNTGSGLPSGTPSGAPGSGTPSGAPGSGTPDSGSGTPGNNTPTGAPGSTTPPPASGSFDCTSAVAFGAQLLFEEVNEGLGIVGMGVQVTHPGDLSHLNGADADDLVVGRSHCFDVFANLVGDYIDDGPGSSDYVYGPAAIWECVGPERDCRVGQMVTRSMYEACMRVPVGCDQRGVEEGIVAGGAHAIQSLCTATQPWDCRGSPLVLDLDGDGLSLSAQDAGARFPLLGGDPVSSGWVKAGDDVLLALDRDGSGCIEGAGELFGEATGGAAGDGFSALARHDDNHDGVIDAADAAYESLLAWSDDGDGVCAPSELSTVADRGVSAIALDADDWGDRDAHGNELGLLGRALSADGRTIPVVDVWFRFEAQP